MVERFDGRNCETLYKRPGLDKRCECTLQRFRLGYALSMVQSRCIVDQETRREPGTSPVCIH
jgi:hypothetical protein